MDWTVKICLHLESSCYKTKMHHTYFTIYYNSGVAYMTFKKKKKKKQNCLHLIKGCLGIFIQAIYYWFVRGYFYLYSKLTKEKKNRGKIKIYIYTAFAAYFIYYPLKNAWSYILVPSFKVGMNKKKTFKK